MPLLSASSKQLQKATIEESAVTLRAKGGVLKTRVAENSVGKARALPSLPCVRTMVPIHSSACKKETYKKGPTKRDSCQ